MNIIEFTGDPMLQLEKFEDIEKYSFYINLAAFEEIKSYSIELDKNIPEFFTDKAYNVVLFAEGGIDEEENEFPDTYIGIKKIENDEYPYSISAIFASDFQYTSPENGEIIYLKKNSKSLKK